MMMNVKVDSEVEEEEEAVVEAEVVEEDSAAEADAEEVDVDTVTEITTDQDTVEEKASILTYKTKKLNKNPEILLNDHTIDSMRFFIYVTNKLSNYNYLKFRF